MRNKLSMAITIALALALIASIVVLADNLLSDGDGLTPYVDTPSLTLGNVCAGSTTTKSIAHVITRNGQGDNAQNVYANSASVTVSISSVKGTGLSANIPSGNNIITLPTDWVLMPNKTQSNPVTSNVTFVAGATGTSLNGTVDYSARGAQNGGGTNIRYDSLTITATVINCDTTPPTLNLPGNMTVEATSASGALVNFSATASDVNPLNPVVTCTPPSGSTFPLDVTTTIDCSAADAVGNTANGSFTIMVVDTTPPTVTPPTNIVVEAVDAWGAVVSYSGESASDTVDGPLTPTCTPALGSTFPLGSNTVTCSVTDSHSNTGTNNFTITVQDTTAPVLSVPADITEESTSADGAVVNFSVSASDLVDGDVAISCDWDSGDTFPLGTTFVSCSATDSNSNTSSGSFNVTVQDTTAPSLTLPVDFSVEAAGSAGAVAIFSAFARDLVDGDVAASCVPASGSTFPLGATTVNCSATDAVGNTGTGSFNVTVVDTTPPALTLPADQQLEATGPGGRQAFFTALALDAVDGALAVSCDWNSGDTFPLGTTTVNCSVSDAAGNEASGSFVIIVEDTIEPIITFVSRTPANGFGWNNGDVTVNWTCEDIVGVVSAYVSETVSTEGTNQSATGTCTDTSGNAASDTQSGINIDITKPSASANRTPAANSFGWNNSDVTVSFSGTDILSGSDSCSVDQIFGEGAGQSASGTCIDKAGNVSDPATVNDINVDKTAPTISGAPNHTANANDWHNVDVNVTFTCDDALSGVAVCTDPVTLGEGAGQSVPGLVTDKAGNSASATVSGINIDKTNPTITVFISRPPNPNHWYNIDTGAPTLSFTCDDALSNLAGACPADYTFDDGENQAYSKTIYDLAGNSASAGVSDVDVDTVAPTITAAVSPARPASGWWNIASDAPIVSYTCSDGTSGVASCSAPFKFGEGGNQTHTGTASDVAGNSASTGINDVDVDLTVPTLTWIGGPANGASYYFGSVPAEPIVPFSDALSGPDKVYFSGYVTAVGSHTMTATAYDKAGNSYSESRTYTVLAWTLNGFYQPVDMGKLNIAKNGSTVPLKFEAFAGLTELTSTSIVSTFVQKESCVYFTMDDIETYASGSTTLRYDTTSGQFIFNWQTPKVVGGCYKVTLTLQDGTSIYADFKLK